MTFYRIVVTREQRQVVTIEAESAKFLAMSREDLLEFMLQREHLWRTSENTLRVKELSVVDAAKEIGEVVKL